MTVPPAIRSCIHVESTNPRRKGLCVKCGRPMTAPRPSRDRRFEDEITRQVVSGLKLDPEPLSAFAGRRADLAQQRYGYDFPDLERDLEVEALEELADCRNYVVWRLDAINRGLCVDAWKVEHLQRALQLVALAFEEVRSARG